MYYTCASVQFVDSSGDLLLVHIDRASGGSEVAADVRHRRQHGERDEALKDVRAQLRRQNADAVAVARGAAMLERAWG